MCLYFFFYGEELSQLRYHKINLFFAVIFTKAKPYRWPFHFNAKAPEYVAALVAAAAAGAAATGRNAHNIKVKQDHFGIGVVRKAAV